MELAEGGDLFDKIESDVGVGEDVAHLYFTQLISAVTYMHSKGVGHRDIKPENILLSAEGNLKIADFGLAVLFEYNGQRKLCTTSCGSPPYTAPEVVTCDRKEKKRLDHGYEGNLVDIWSCAVVLFVLLVGNTPWDEPLDRSYEFSEYVKTEGRPDDELWHNLPDQTLPLLRGMMKVEPSERMPLQDIQRHPWFRRSNPYLGSTGALENPVGLATQMFESMRIDFSHDPVASQHSQRPAQGAGTDAMDVDVVNVDNDATTPRNEIMFDWGTRLEGNDAPSNDPSTSSWDEQLAEEPSCSQFSSVPRVPLTRTQFARQFRDILPSHSLTRFFSFWPNEKLHATLCNALQMLHIQPAGASQLSDDADGRALDTIKIRSTDGRNCTLIGDIVICSMTGIHGQVLEVDFVKAKGDPLEWRRLFKNVVILSKEAVFRPDESMDSLSQMNVQ